MQGATNHSFRFSICVPLLLLAFLAAACGHKNAVVAPPSAPPVSQSSKTNTPPRQEAPSLPATPGGSGVSADRTPIAALTPAGASIPGPLIRIGLSIQAEELRIAAAGEFYLVEKIPEAPRRAVRGEVRVRLERPLYESGETYRVQVASLSNQEAAENLSRRLGEQFSAPVVVQKNAASGTNQVRIGRFASRGEAQEFAAGPLAAAGYREFLIVREAGEPVRGEPVLALRGPENLYRVSGAGYLLLAGSNGDFLRLNGKPYRGSLDLSLSSSGRLTVVNQLGVEEYLLGVVPAELSPVAYPEAAALAAQAIAARTYALKNMGRFRAEGFDLSDDVRTQVYGGVSLEKEASSDAVRQTSGIAIYYGGSLIEAMYTSTCGGRTEDIANVFDTAPVPYLTSVACTVESSPAETPGATVEGNHDLGPVRFSDEGIPVNRELELARVLGLTSPGTLTQDFLDGVPGEAEIKGWIEKARLLAGKTDTEAAVPDTRLSERAGFIRYAAERFFGVREIERRVSTADAAYYAHNFSDGPAIPAAVQRVLAYLIQRRLWQPFPDNSVRPDQPIRRGDALALLVRWITNARPEVLKTGVCVEPGYEIGGPQGKRLLAIKRGSRTERLALAQDLRLFKAAGGRSMPVSRLRVIGNEKLAFHQAPNGEIDFLEVELSLTGASSDRFSPVATWQVTFTRAVIAEKLRSLAANAGEIRDLKPARLGNSGRVVQLEIIGSRGSVVVNGYRVRGALGLKDTLYTLSRTMADDGSVASFTFDGRGWGHGIGLCQTGAVGMARAGRSAEEILKTYYQGVELRRAY
jgi:stage II sporulation protein D